MSIWFAPPDLEQLNRIHAATAVSALGIRITAVGDDSLSGTMPVDQRTLQPYGLLHGGASVLLAETLGSAASMCCVDLEKVYCVGLEINANHVRGVRDGIVTGVARPIHLGSHIARLGHRDPGQRQSVGVHCATDRGRDADREAVVTQNQGDREKRISRQSTWVEKRVSASTWARRSRGARQ